MKFHPHEDSPVELEFLVHKRGPDEKRAATLQDGVTAQQLPYLDLLRAEPWSIRLDRVPGFEDVRLAKPLQLPNPVSYILQKVLSWEQERSSEKKRKDCYYIYEAAVLFRDVPELKGLSIDLAQSNLVHPNWLDAARRSLRLHFKTPQSFGPAAVARISRELRATAGNAVPIDADMAGRIVTRLADRLDGLR